MAGAGTVWDFAGVPPERGLTRVLPADGQVLTTWTEDGTEYVILGHYADLSRPPLDWRAALAFEPESPDPEGLREAAEVERPAPLLEPTQRVTLTRVHPALAGPLPGQGIAA